MSTSPYNPAADPAMHDLFRQEVEAHAKSLTSGLLEFEKTKDTGPVTEELMRAAHSIKGAARMVGIDVVVKIAHAMEDCFVKAQSGTITLTPTCIDVLLKGIDSISAISEGKQDTLSETEIEELIDNLHNIKFGKPIEAEPVADNQATNSGSMLDLFQADAINLFEEIQSIIADSDDDSGLDIKSIKSILSNIHTLRSGAKLSGASVIGELLGIIEGIILSDIENDNAPDFSSDSPLSMSINAINFALSNSVRDEDNKNLSEITALLRESPDINNVLEDKDEDKPGPSTADTPAEIESDHSIKISTKRLNRLVGLAGESVVESRWVRSHADAMLVYKRRQTEIINALDNLRSYFDETEMADHVTELFGDIQKRANNARSFLSSRLNELDEYDRRVTGLSERLNLEVLQTRMRPFSDCTHGFERMVRDLARSMNKDIELVIIGDNTQVDREILTRIEAPLNHIIRNSIDHGIETPEQRINNGKPGRATIKIEASHKMGMLSISISDDGRGVNLDTLRERIIERNLSSQEMVKHLSQAELLDFLYLPGFSTRSDVTEISGRGVGLDVVHSTIQEMRGQIRTSSIDGKGIRIQLLLPLTLSVIRSLLATVGGQAYAFPLARIDSIHTLNRNDVQTLEGKQYFTLSDRHIGLIDSSQVLEVDNTANTSDEIPVIVLGDRKNSYGLVVESFIGERDLAVHQLDPRLGKIRDISAAALLEDGEPALIVDIDDMIRSIEIIVSDERLSKIGSESKTSQQGTSLRVLVVDDSITVREVERKLLESHGYHVDVAVDGMDGWNTVQATNYDLIISDIDMPRMNGIEFVTMLKSDQDYRKIPVMIVSYKDRQEDKEAGLNAGADYYLTKGSFHDESLIEAVIDLIGEAV